MQTPIFTILFVFASLFFGVFTARGQSRDQNFPTPITSNEITGIIRARDIGDSRLTTYFYTFDGSQGDIFVNILTRNLTGDIDIFTADSLQPLSKVVLYADSAQNETGRVIYLRQPARLILRIQGRSPDDDPATFRIKFAGSFVASASKAADDGPTVESSDKGETSGVRVNSVGTIIEVLPKTGKDEAKASAIERSAKKDENSADANKGTKDNAKTADVEKTSKGDTKPAEVDKAAESNEPDLGRDAGTARGDTRARSNPDVKTVFGKKPPRSKPVVSVDPPPKGEAETGAKIAKRKDAPPVTEVKPPDPLASIHLVILMKDGGTIERPMNEVIRFSVDKGVLTVVEKGGKISRFSILNVEKVTIQ